MLAMAVMPGSGDQLALLVGDALPANPRAVAHHREGGDERHDPAVGDEQAVDQAERHADDKSAEPHDEPP